MESGQSGQFPFSWTYALGFAHVSSLSLLGAGQLPVLEGSSLTFRFPASGYHGLVTVKIRFQLCLSRFGTLLLYHRFITDFDAIALHSTFWVLRLCSARKAPSGMCRDLGGRSTLQRDRRSRTAIVYGDMTMDDSLSTFADPPRELSVLPFWFWNDELDAGRSGGRLGISGRMGCMGLSFIHAWGGAEGR